MINQVRATNTTLSHVPNCVLKFPDIRAFSYPLSIPQSFERGVGFEGGSHLPGEEVFAQVVAGDVQVLEGLVVRQHLPQALLQVDKQV